ncbi:MAG: hypothetical protein WAX06_10690 [Lactococcus lactis]
MATNEELIIKLSQLKTTSDELSKRLIQSKAVIGKQGKIINQLTRPSKSGMMAVQQMTLCESDLTSVTTAMRQLGADVIGIVNERQTV